MTYGKRLLLLMGIDTVIVITAVFIGGFLLYNVDYLHAPIIFASSATLVISHHILAHIFKLYKRIWQYASIHELVAIFKAVSLSIAATALMQNVVFQSLHSRTLIITWMLHILLIGGSRFGWRMYRDHNSRPKKNKKRTLIIGAGGGGTMVVRHLLQKEDSELEPIAFIDDDETKHRLEVMGLPVVGSVEDVPEAVNNYRIEQVIIAIPSLDKREMQRIYKACQQTKVKTQIMPRMEDVFTGKVAVSEFRDVQVEDLLGRDPVELDTKGIGETLTGKTVLITGAGGSIGSEVCRQAVRFQPKAMILLGNEENSIYYIERDLHESQVSADLFTEIVDVKDREKMFTLLNTYLPDVVFHAAAHKHVPLMERNPEEAVKNNVLGTKNTAEAAAEAGTDTFVMISTDKAVNPTSVMGATKRLAEMVVQDMDTKSNTHFVSVRFGNVLGSRGSVIPHFKRQIQAGGPVTVTHPEMERYFMTIPEASRLVLQAGALAKGGEIFVLDMGEPVKIIDLAKNLIELSGHNIEDIGIEFTGMRPGEKLYEELLGEKEVHPEQIYPKIYVGRAENVEIEALSPFFYQLNKFQSRELRQVLISLAQSNEFSSLEVPSVY